MSNLSGAAKEIAKQIRNGELPETSGGRKALAKLLEMCASEIDKNDYLREALEDMVLQFASTTVKNGRLCLSSGGLSSLEYAFDLLGWKNPHPIPERECMADGCSAEATCGTPTPDGYKRLCSKHFRELTE